jgi:hypothetical protein
MDDNFIAFCRGGGTDLPLHPSTALRNQHYDGIFDCGYGHYVMYCSYTTIFDFQRLSVSNTSYLFVIILYSAT